MGQYPVINLSLKSAKQPDFEMAYASIIDEISKEFIRHYFILKSDKLLDNEKESFMNIVNKKASPIEYAKSLQFLSICLEKYYDKKAIILIDEYDVPLENAFLYEKGNSTHIRSLSTFEEPNQRFGLSQYDEMIKFIRSLFESALKTNSALEFAVITGCLRISKESIFTGLNNLEIISILNKSYDEYFGFTNDEVRKICEDYKIENKYETIKKWYNGYIFGDANVYNPWSVMRFVKDLKIDINEYPSSYWANTSSNSIVKILIERADDEVKAEIEALIEGKTIEKPVHEDITYDEVYDNMDNLYNFMFFTGYFKKVNEVIDEKINQKYIELKIPNEEVKYIFRTKVLKWFEQNIKTRDFTKMHNAIIERNAETFEEELSDVLLETISFNDAYENFYHGFVTGILSNMKGYIVKSNRESGSGRGDIFIKPVSRRKTAVILKLKVAKTFDELEKRADDALKQIDEKKCEMELRDDGYKNIIKYGISFFKKDCFVKINMNDEIIK